MANLVLRTMYIDPDVDDELRTEAFDTRTSKNDLLRQYLKLGMEVAKQARIKSSAGETSTVKADLVAEGIRSSAEPIARVVLANLAPKGGKAVIKKLSGGATSGAHKVATKAASAPKRTSAPAVKKPSATAARKASSTSRKKSATSKAATA